MRVKKQPAETFVVVKEHLEPVEEKPPLCLPELVMMSRWW